MYCIIYLLFNDINTKVYVGQTWLPLQKRWNAGYKNSGHINNAINKYGKKHFHYMVLTISSTQEIVDYWEDFFIKKYDSIENGYNLKGGGSHGKFSQQTKQKISKALSGENHPLYGKLHSPETLEKMSSIKIGKVCSDEHKMNISKSKRGENNPWFGKTRSENTKIKMSESQKGHTKLTKEQIELIKFDKRTHKVIAQEYGVHFRTIANYKKK